MLGGTIQQAVAIAQRRPHPYCPEGKEGTETTESLCSVSKSTPQISLVNGGAIRGEIAANTSITREMVRDILPFTSDTIAYVELMGSDVVQVLENALAYVTRETPLNPYLQSGYPYASGLKFDVDLTSETKVSNVRVLNSETGEYAPIDPSTSYWMVTNRYLAENGDGYLTDVTPLQVAPTELGYTYELEQYLIGLSPEYWVPPTLDEMSTTSFNATGVSVASVDDVPIEYFESEPGQ
jgi:2',3'-cyclic-nucleotide 2'-phosphodiesterase (5'-nucleotidase family)